MKGTTDGQAAKHVTEKSQRGRCKASNELAATSGNAKSTKPDRRRAANVEVEDLDLFGAAGQLSLASIDPTVLKGFRLTETLRKLTIALLMAGLVFLVSGLWKLSAAYLIGYFVAWSVQQ